MVHDFRLGCQIEVKAPYQSYKVKVLVLELDVKGQEKNPRTSPVVQWLRLCAPSAGGPGSIPSQRTRSHVPQLRVCKLQLRPSSAK